MQKRINFFFIFFFFCRNLASVDNFENDIALITNQESHKLDVIDLKKKKKIDEILVGKKPAGIIVNNLNRKAFISNPGSHNVLEIDFLKKSKKFYESGPSPISIFLTKDKTQLFASNWYDNTVSLIDLKKDKIIKKIVVGNSPAGIFVDYENNNLFVANRESNSVSVVDISKLKEVKRIPVESAPFGVFSEPYINFVFVTNVQSNSISLIHKKNLNVIKNIKVEKWPYQVAYDKENNKLYVTNQRSNSISIIGMKKKKVIGTIDDVCEYPEGIDISYNENLIIVACWFEDNIILLDLDTNDLVKKILVSGGPRAFGSFILENGK